ncbi:MAG: hypothetical protein U0625_06165 [Phycisphaerales bacterium]
MKSAALRYSVLALGTAAAIAAVVPTIPFLLSTRGVAGPGMMDAVHPAGAALALALGLGAATAIACVVGRLINAAVGLCVLGFAVAIVSMRSGTVLDAAFDGDALLPLACETLGWSVAVAVMSAIVFRVSGPLPDIPARDPKGPFRAEIFNTDSLRGLVAGAAMVVLLWFAARTEMKGQALGAAVCGGIATAFAGRRLLGNSQPILLFAAPVLAAGIAQLVTALTFKVPLVDAAVSRSLMGWSVAMPLDIVAGALVGVPLGLGWTRNGEDDGE